MSAWRRRACARIAQVGDDSMLIAYEMVEAPSPRPHGRPRGFGSVPARALGARHGACASTASRIVTFGAPTFSSTATGKPWLAGFAFSEVAASDDQLDGDVAQLLAALSLTVGADRSVTSAVETLGPHTVGAALPRLQPNALSDSTRVELEAAPGPPGGAAGHRRATMRGERADLRPARADQQATRLHRGDARGGHVLPPSAAGRPAGRHPRDRCMPHWRWVPLVVLFSALTYVGAALGIGGAVPARLRAVPTLLAQVAASFASNLAPAGVGGMALNVRYLRKSGRRCSGGGVERRAQRGGRLRGAHRAHARLLRLGRQIGLRLDLRCPAGRSSSSAVAVVAVCIAAAFAIPATRRLLATKLVPALGQRVEWPRRGDSESRQDRAAVRRLRGGHPELRLGRLLLDRRVRRRPRPRAGRRRVPRRFGHRHRRAHSRRARRARGGGDRGSRRRRHAGHARRSRPCSCSGSPPTGSRSSPAGSRSTTSAARTSSRWSGSVGVVTVAAMKAAVLEHIPGELVIDDVQIGAVGPHDVLVRTVAAGLCHSDLHFMEGKYPCPVPAVLGHESAGVVEAVGEQVTYVQPGDHVISCISGFCGACRYCLSGRPNLCDKDGPGARSRRPAAPAARRSSRSTSSSTCRASPSSCSCTRTCS